MKKDSVKFTPSRISLILLAAVIAYLLSPPWVMIILGCLPPIDSPGLAAALEFFYKPFGLLYTHCGPYRDMINWQILWVEQL